MGNNKKEMADEMEDILGLGKEGEEANADEIKPDEVKPDEKSTDDNKPDEEQAPVTKTTVVTDEQLNIGQDIAKIDVKIQDLKDVTVDVDKFYENIEEHLSEEEIALEFSDKASYMKLINTKAKEYEEKNSNTQEIQDLEKQKEDKQGIYDRQSAIVEVSAKHPQYNHEKVLEFFNKDLTKNQQDEIFASSSSYADVYEKAYVKLQESNPANIKDVDAPNIPDVNNVRKSTPSSKDTDDGLLDEDKQLQEALGL